MCDKPWNDDGDDDDDNGDDDDDDQLRSNEYCTWHFCYAVLRSLTTSLQYVLFDKS